MNAKSTLRSTRPPRETAWLGKADMLRVFDVSEQVFERSIRPTFPGDAVRMAAGRLAFNCRACIEAWAVAKYAGDVDPALRGVNSPALERYRTERAALARLERLEKEGRLLPAAEIRRGLRRLADLLRVAGERLGRRFGAEAQDILTATLDEFDRELDQLHPPPDAEAGELPEIPARGTSAEASAVTPPHTTRRRPPRRKPACLPASGRRQAAAEHPQNPTKGAANDAQ